MKRTFNLKALLLALLTVMAWSANAEVKVTIDATNFPDANFRNYLLSQDYGIDGTLAEDEINSLHFMDVADKDISDLKGIEFFTALVSLYCDNNKLTTLDVTKNTTLRDLFCEDNQLTVLDVSKNTALIWLECDGNRLTTLDVSKNTKLERLYCHNNSIKGADMVAFISSLPQNATEFRCLFCVVDISKDALMGNVCTKAQVAAAKAKGWIATAWNENYETHYEGNDNLSGISDAVFSSTKTAPVFTLSGQRLAAPRKGINIVGGKKIMVK